MKRVAVWMIGSVCMFGFLGAGYAHFAKAEDAIGYRQAVMVVIGHHFTRIGAVVKGAVPYNRQEVAKNADLVATLSKLPWDAFLTAGTDKGETHMKPEVLQNKDAFKARAQAMEIEAAKLARVGASGSPDDLRSQFGATARTCKACHDDWRTH